MSAFFFFGKKNVIIRRHDVIVNFFDVVVFLSSSLVTDPCFMPTSLLVLELRHFLFITDLTRNLEIGIPQSECEFCLIFGDWSELGITNLTWMFLMKIYLILQNARFTAFAVSELLKEKKEIPPLRSGLNHCPSCVFKSYLSKIRLNVGHSPNWHFLWLLIIENFRFG